MCLTDPVKTSILAAVTGVAMAFSSVAGAQGQSWEITGGTYTFLGCGTAAGGNIQCGLRFVQTVAGEGGTFQLEAKNVQAFSQIGQLSRATRVNVAGQGFMGPDTAPSTQGQPIDTLFELGGLPMGTKSIRALIIEGHKLDRVPVSGVSLAGNDPVVRGGAPSEMTPPRRGSSPAAPMTGMPERLNVPGGFSVQYSDCRFIQGALTCTATFTLPR